MLFDVIVSNPPFQNPNAEASSGKLWVRFAEKYFTLSRGHLAVILPNTWTKGKIAAKGSGRLFDLFKKHAILTVNNQDCGEYFPNIGLNFSYVVIALATRTNKSILISGGKTHEVDLQNIQTLPKDSAAISLVNRFFEWQSPQPHTLVTNTRNKSIPVDDNGNSVVFSNGNNFTASDCCYDSTPKVVVPWANSLSKSQYGRIIAGDQTVFFYEEDHGQQLLSFIQSSLVRFCVGQVRTSMHNEGVRFLPKIDLSRFWTEQELYDHFCLTQEEIALVENTG